MKTEYIKLIGMHNTLVMMRKHLWAMQGLNIQPTYDALTDALTKLDTLKENTKAETTAK